MQWRQNAEEIVHWVEDLLLLTSTIDGGRIHTKFIGYGNRKKLIFLSLTEATEFAMTVEQVLEFLADCNPEAKVAVTTDEEDVGFIDGGNDWNDDVFVLTVQKEEFIRQN